MIDYILLFALCLVAIVWLIKLIHVIDSEKRTNLTDRHMLKINKDHDKHL